jgi:hypothetical protein
LPDHPGLTGDGDDDAESTQLWLASRSSKNASLQVSMFSLRSGKAAANDAAA